MSIFSGIKTATEIHRLYLCLQSTYGKYGSKNSVFAHFSRCKMYHDRDVFKILSNTSDGLFYENK